MGLRELVVADLQRAQRLMERSGGDLDPQFRIASPSGDWWIGITLSQDEAERVWQLKMVSQFMAWKLSPAFTQAVELAQPAALACVGCSHGETVGVVSRIARNPLRFSPPVAVSVAEIGDDVPALLPRGAMSISESEIVALRLYFGAAGAFPAVHIGSGRIGAD